MAVKVLKKFTYQDNVLGRAIKYAEIELPSRTIHIGNTPVSMNYIYDTPLDKLHDKKFYRLPFDNPNINYKKLYKAYKVVK